MARTILSFLAKIVNLYTVTGLFLSNQNTIELRIDLLALVLREASKELWLKR